MLEGWGEGDWKENKIEKRCEHIIIDILLFSPLKNKNQRIIGIYPYFEVRYKLKFSKL